MYFINVIRWRNDWLQTVTVLKLSLYNNSPAHISTHRWITEQAQPGPKGFMGPLVLCLHLKRQFLLESQLNNCKGAQYHRDAK